jgi:hypothetical protein
MTNKRRFNIILLTLIAVLSISLDVKAVSREEMENAKTITAKLYLRYANNGSGYLDDVVATSMTELKAKLKKKELENLEAFNSVPVPPESEYAGWDKAQLMQFWSTTFLDNPKLLAEGKLARKRIATQIHALNITDSTVTKTTNEEPVTEAVNTAATNPEEALQAMEDSVASANAELESKEIEPKEAGSEDSTITYVVILCILVAAVAALVIYASRILKKQPDDNNDQKVTVTDENVTKVLYEKDNEINSLKARIEEMNTAANEYREHILYLKEQLKKVQAELDSRPTAVAPTTIAEQVQPTNTQPAAAPRSNRSRVIYLSRANKNGIFLGAQREPDARTSLFKLVTNDGVTGTFALIDSQHTDDLIFSNPEESLAYSCSCKDMNTDDKDKVITERGGTAIFEDGRWRVLRKALIKFE